MVLLAYRFQVSYLGTETAACSAFLIQVTTTTITRVSANLQC